MSAKYRRVKQADLDLPAPLRWLTRAFSSITLAVILLLLVALWGLLGTIPLRMLAIGGLDAAVVFAAAGVAAGLIYLLTRGGISVVRGIAAGLLLAGATVAAVRGVMAVHDRAVASSWLQEHASTVIYQLPAFEMTMTEYYGWWPMDLLLLLFVVNMVWATIRRIEFSFVNIGVLSVHGGIVLLAIGAMVYGRFKVEGDTVIHRRDLGGGFVSSFYGTAEPAIYLATSRGEKMIPVPDLPRYNDYAPGELDIRLHERQNAGSVLGENLRVTIPGFYAYAEPVSAWRPAAETDPQASPAIRLAMERQQTGEAAEFVLAADRPAERVLENRLWSIQYLVDPGEKRLKELLTPVPGGGHGLIVEVPGEDFREVYAIEPGQTIEVGDTGYALEIEDIGPYPIPFVSEGYQDARDTRAVVKVEGPGKTFTRMAMNRYPERSQDFSGSGGGPAPMMGPMGERSDPDPAIRLVYLDGSQMQYYLVGESPEDEQLDLIVRLGGQSRPMHRQLPDDGFPVPTGGQGLVMLRIAEHWPAAKQVMEPRPVPEAERDSRAEGQYGESLLPVDVELDRPADAGGPWRERVWLHFMRYPMPSMASGNHRPRTVELPDGRTLRLTFSRERHALPFAMGLEDFEMQSYEGSDIPRDFVATLLIGDLSESGVMRQMPDRHVISMNHPLMYEAANAPLGLQRVKISQVEWDPPRRDDPQAEAKNADGRFINQQRYTVVGIGNNVGISIIWAGGGLALAGIPWAFYLKPLLVRRRKRTSQEPPAGREDSADADAPAASAEPAGMQS
ncbi:MAG: hypothetical protein ACLFV3_01505 [Phycisphaeraceae bacterium]